MKAPFTAKIGNKKWESVAIPCRIKLGVNENPPFSLSMCELKSAPMSPISSSFGQRKADSGDEIAITHEIMRSRLAQCKTRPQYFASTPEDTIHNLVPTARGREKESPLGTRLHKQQHKKEN